MLDKTDLHVPNALPESPLGKHGASTETHTLSFINEDPRETLAQLRSMNSAKWAEIEANGSTERSLHAPLIHGTIDGSDRSRPRESGSTKEATPGSARHGAFSRHDHLPDLRLGDSGADERTKHLAPSAVNGLDGFSLVEEHADPKDGIPALLGPAEDGNAFADPQPEMAPQDSKAAAPAAGSEVDAYGLPVQDILEPAIQLQLLLRRMGFLSK